MIQWNRQASLKSARSALSLPRLREESADDDARFCQMSVSSEAALVHNVPLMTFRSAFPVIVLLFLLVPNTGFSQAESPDTPEVLESLVADALGIEDGETRLPGVGLAEGVTQVTGVAISPLLGVAALGSWNYFRTEPEDRHLLPWVCHPLFWGIGFGVLALVFFKDTLGTILPAFAKKPLDLIELFEDKFSAIIAGTAFVPFLVGQVSEQLAPILPAEPITDQAATIPVLAQIGSLWIFMPVALIGFAVVWIVSHTINVLILLSPFGIFDAVLKLGKLCLLSLMGLLYLINPVIAAVLALVIVAVCAYLAPSAFRLGFYGTVISADAVRSVFFKKSPDPEKIRCFLAKRGNEGLKVRTLGRVRPGSDDHIVFRSRRFFFGPWRSVRLPSNGALYLTNGLLVPTLQTVCDDSGRTQTLLHLLPRYRSHGEEVAEMLGVEFRETPILRGFSATKEWAVSFLRAGRGESEESLTEEEAVAS